MSGTVAEIEFPRFDSDWLAMNGFFACSIQDALRVCLYIFVFGQRETEWKREVTVISTCLLTYQSPAYYLLTYIPNCLPIYL